MNYNNESTGYTVNTQQVVDKPKRKNPLTIPFMIISYLLVIETIFIIIVGIQVLVKVKTNKRLEVNKSETTSEQLDETFETLKEIDEYYSGAYIEDVDYEDLTLKMANALVASYGDKYGIYLDPELSDEQDAELNNTLSGIGVLIRAEEAETDDEVDRLYVIESYKGSDALEKGIVRGCMITKVNGEEFNFEEVSYNDVIDKIRGKAGTHVEITFINNDGEEITEDIERRKVETTTVTYKVINNEIGYINIRDFTSNTDEEFRNVLKYMENREIDKLIFDLRDNSGGLLETVVNMLDDLLPAQNLIYIENKDKEIVEVYKSDKKHYDFEGVCIINENSASASELFVKSLQEQGHIVIGETSYGKGTVCSVIPLETGGSLQISTYRYLTSSRECVEGIGVIPDIEIKLPEEKEKIQYKLEITEDDLIIQSIKYLME